jgi:hypothetical protein
VGRFNILIPLLTITLLAPRAVPAESRSVTFYSDGVIVELEAAAVKGSIDIPLPTALVEGSLRLKPASGTGIQRVDFVSALAGSDKDEKGLDGLLEQKNRLGDRLQALATREEYSNQRPNPREAKPRARPRPIRTRCRPSVRAPSLP